MELGVEYYYYSRRAIMETKERMERNKKNVIAFYDLIINKKDYETAQKLYVGPRYKQHNPLVKDYPEGLKEFIEFLKTNHPDANSEIIRIFADGDFVICHVHSRRPPNVHRAIVEIFRLTEDGKIDEHWDVIQEVPAESANSNGMF
jgi:predicted SnoaL-like aldol condensation-catalyzing enzyme